MQLHLYLITRTGRAAGYDEYEEAVVAARSSRDAAKIHPDDQKGENVDGAGTWVPPDEVSVKCVGRAARGVRRGPICASFRAG